MRLALVIICCLFLTQTLGVVKRNPKIIDEDDDEDLNLDNDKSNQQAATKPAPDVREDDIFDDDVFIGQPPSKEKKKTESSAPKAAKVEVEEPDNYYWEIAAIVVICLFTINFYFGSKTNDNIAQQWFNSFFPLFQTQFAVTSSQQDKTPLIKDSQSCYQFYATGRRFCQSLLVTLDLRRRHDLFGLIGAVFDLSPIHDTMTIEVAMDDNAMESFVFAIVKRKEEKRLKKQLKDLENYAGVLKSDRLPETLVILTDTPELERDLIDENVSRTLQKSDDLFNLLHFTDENVPVYPSFEKSKKVLRFKFLIPSAVEDWERLGRLIKMSIHFIDVIATTNLSSVAAARSKAKRKVVADALHKAGHAQRQENLAKKKEEAKQAALAKQPELSEAGKKKKEERDAKKLAKQNKPKVKILR